MVWLQALHLLIKSWVCVRLQTLAAAIVLFSVVSAYTLTSAPTKEGNIILEQAQKEEKTNPYNMPIGTSAPQAETPAVPAN